MGLLLSSNQTSARLGYPTMPVVRRPSASRQLGQIHRLQSGPICTRRSGPIRTWELEIRSRFDTVHARRLVRSLPPPNLSVPAWSYSKTWWCVAQCRVSARARASRLVPAHAPGRRTNPAPSSRPNPPPTGSRLLLPARRSFDSVRGFSDERGQSWSRSTTNLIWRLLSMPTVPRVHVRRAAMPLYAAYAHSSRIPSSPTCRSCVLRVRGRSAPVGRGGLCGWQMTRDD